MQIIQCVPNFSEGRRKEVIARLGAAVRGVPGIRLLDVQSDADHNRSVLTFIGPPQPVLAAALAAMRVATESIDMEQHTGSHPRIGATDVVPFVPVAGVALDQCVQFARRFGELVASELHIPVYLYGAAAQRDERVLLANIRRGQYEGLKAEVDQTGRRPDFGEPRLHPTAGATAVGARRPMVAYNVYLSGVEMAVARRIARQVRERDGGLPGVQAIGLDVAATEQVQVSMNLLDTDQTSIWRAYQEVRQLAEAAGGTVVRSEVIGLVTLSAVTGSLAEAIGCHELAARQVLEAHLVGSGPAEEEDEKCPAQ